MNAAHAENKKSFLDQLISDVRERIKRIVRPAERIEAAREMAVAEWKRRVHLRIWRSSFEKAVRRRRVRERMAKLSRRINYARNRG